MIAAGSIWDHFLDCLIPLFAVAVYLISSTSKSRKKPPLEAEKKQQRTVSAPPPRPKKEHIIADLYPVHRKTKELQSSIEERRIDSAISTRELSSSITAERASTLISSEMLKHIDLDPIPKSKKGISRARKLFKRQSLRNAFLLQEVLNRPYD